MRLFLSLALLVLCSSFALPATAAHLSAPASDAAFEGARSLFAVPGLAPDYATPVPMHLAEACPMVVPPRPYETPAVPCRSAPWPLTRFDQSPPSPPGGPPE